MRSRGNGMWGRGPAQRKQSFKKKKNIYIQIIFLRSKTSLSCFSLVEKKSEISPHVRLNKKGGKITHLSKHIQIIFYFLKPPYLAFHWWRERWENPRKNQQKRRKKITYFSISLYIGVRLKRADGNPIRDRKISCQ